MKKKEISPKKKEISRSQKGVYMDDRVWSVAEKRAADADRSANYIIEKALQSYFQIA